MKTSRPARLVPAMLCAAVILALLLPHPATTAPEQAKPMGPVEKIRTSMNPRPEGWQAPDHAAAMERAKTPREFVAKVKREDPKLRQIRFKNLGFGVADIKYSLMILDSPQVNTFENLYGPARFMHSKHAASLNGDCALCHHASPEGADAGVDRLSETVACRSCHQEAFNP